MQSVAKKYHNVENIDALDADHIVARTILEDLPESWIALFPVYRSANRGFGHIERKLPKVKEGFNRLTLSPLAAFKVLNGTMPRDHDELRAALASVDGQIDFEFSNFVGNFRQAIREQMEAYFRSKKEPIR